MKIADTGANAPNDDFKIEHCPKAGEKIVPDKINTMVHCTDEDLLKVADMRKNHTRNMKYSEKVIVFASDPKERLFDKIINKGKAAEQARIDREEEIVRLANRPQRGAKNENVASHHSIA